MQQNPGNNRQIVYERGTTSDRVGLNVKLYYCPLEAGELSDGIPGDLQSGDAAASQVSSLPPVRAREIMDGGEIKTSMRLNGPSAFTVMSVIKEVHIFNPDAAA